MTMKTWLGLLLLATTLSACDGPARTTGSGGDGRAARLRIPGGITVDDAGNVFIAESHRLRKLIAEGEQGPES